MGITRLQLRDFRCFSQLEVEFDPALTCIIGRNAAGKSSLLEAIAVIARLQSPRTNSLASVIRNGCKGLVLDGYLSGYHLQFYFSATRRKIALDAVEQKSAAGYLAIERVVYFGNSDIELIRGSAEARRRFLDFLGSQLFPNYREILRAYEKALRSRNATLKRIPARPKELAAYTKALTKYGLQLTALRAFLVEQLEPHVYAAFGGVSDRGEVITLHYQPGATADFEQALADTASEEQRLGVTLVGPHRDDVQFLIAARPADLFASEGQQRTAAVALKLAQAKLLENTATQGPLLLLDDVFGELDLVRRNRLLSWLPANSQRVVTTTSLAWLSELPGGKILEICENGNQERQVRQI